VAIVNNDEGANLNGKKQTIGDDLIKELKKSDDFKWDFVSKKEAMEGLKEEKYYFAIELPKDFSKKATTVMDKNPAKMEITYIPNKNLNFIAAQIGGNAIEKMKTKISNELTKTYVENVFDKVNDMKSGLTKASDGSKQLYDGLSEIKNGTSQLNQGLIDKQSSVISLRDGASTLKTSLFTFKDAMNALTNGSATISSGMTSLQSGMIQVQTGVDQLVPGSLSLKNGIVQTAQGVTSLQEGAKKLAGGNALLNAKLKQYVNNHPELANDPAMMELVGISGQVTAGSSSLQTGTEALQTGIQQLVAGSDKVYQGQVALQQGLSQVSVGQQKLTNGYLTFHQNLQKANQGSIDLSNGSTQLASGTNEVANGWNSLITNTASLDNGVQKTVDGSKELYENLSDGATKASQVNTTNKTYDMMASPVKITEKDYSDVDNYGTGFAPYFISLGLFVGALVFSTVFNLNEFKLLPKSGFGAAVSRFVLLSLVGTCQALILSFILVHFIHLDVAHVKDFVLFAILVSIAGFSLIYFLVSSMANPGKFIAIILLILQLVTSGGSYPVELIEPKLQFLHHYLPMTYSILGFKEAISGVHSGDLHNGFLLYGGMALGFVLLTWITYSIKLYFIKKQTH
jgi:putative membrane protein